MSAEQWNQVSRTLDFIMTQPTGKPIKENPAIYGIKGEPEKKTRKPKKEKEQPPAQQLRMF
jgi:hypothetical protein